MESRIDVVRGPRYLEALVDKVQDTMFDAFAEVMVITCRLHFNQSQYVNRKLSLIDIESAALLHGSSGVKCAADLYNGPS